MSVKNTLTYEAAKAMLIANFERDIVAHESGKWDAVGEGFDEFDAHLPRDAGPEFNKLYIALQFWTGWIDCAEHGWNFYEPLTMDDWPRLARHIIAEVGSDSEISEDNVIHFFGLSGKKESQSADGPALPRAASPPSRSRLLLMLIVPSLILLVISPFIGLEVARWALPHTSLIEFDGSAKSVVGAVILGINGFFTFLCRHSWKRVFSKNGSV